jgi:hypothetical protein
MAATSAAIQAEIAALEEEYHEHMKEGKYGDADLALIAQTALKGAADVLMAYGAGDASHPDNPFHETYGAAEESKRLIEELKAKYGLNGPAQG